MVRHVDEHEALAQDLLDYGADLARAQARDSHAVHQVIRDVVASMLRAHDGQVLDEHLIRDRAGNIATVVGYILDTAIAAERARR